MMSEEDRTAHFEGRKRIVIEEVDKILKQYEVGLKPALQGWPQAIVPTILFSDTKQYDEDLNRKERRTKASKARRK